MESDWVGKRVCLFFQDLEKVLRKIGTIVSVDEAFITIRTYDGEQAIPLQRVVRMEVQK